MGIVIMTMGAVLILLSTVGIIAVSMMLRKKKKRIREEVYEIYDQRRG